MMTRKLAARPDFDMPLFMGALLLPIATFLLCSVVPPLDFIQSLAHGNKPGHGFIYGFILLFGSIVTSVALLIILAEARSVRSWQRRADQVIQDGKLFASHATNSGDNKDEVLLRSWIGIWFLLFGIIAGGVGAVIPPHQNSWAWRIGGAVFFFASIWFFLVRFRWSPWGIPEVEITRDAIKIPNPTLSVDGRSVKEWYSYKERQQYVGVFSIPLKEITSISWITSTSWSPLGYNGAPELLIHTNRFIVTHPLSKKPPLDVMQKDCVIRSPLSGGGITPDAIVAFAERLIEQTRQSPQ